MSTEKYNLAFLFCFNMCCRLILDCYVEGDGAMKSNAFFCLRKTGCWLLMQLKKNILMCEA